MLFLIRRKKKAVPAGQQINAENAIGKTAVTVAPLPNRDFWKETAEAQSNPGAFSVLLPKAIVAELEKHFRQSGLTREKAFSILSDNYYEEAKELKEIIAVCDQFRYGFGDETLQTSDLLARARALLDKIR